MRKPSQPGYNEIPSRAPQVAGGNPAVAGKNSGPTRVLVVDDEPLVRWSISETLANQGYDVSEADHAASAIQALSAGVQHMDLVLLDLRLPDSDDLRVLDAARRLSPDTQVIVMTAFANPELLEDARRHGAFAAMSKPFDMDDLGPLVRRALAASSD